MIGKRTLIGTLASALASVTAVVVFAAPADAASCRVATVTAIGTAVDSGTGDPYSYSAHRIIPSSSTCLDLNYKGYSGPNSGFIRFRVYTPGHNSPAPWTFANPMVTSWLVMANGSGWPNGTEYRIEFWENPVGESVQILD